MLLDGAALRVSRLTQIQTKLGITPGGGVPPHAATHEDGGADEIDVTGLTGVLATPQTPATHATSHENGGADEISVTGLSGLLADPQTPTAHATSHENGGSDEISVAGLSGALADPQTPTAHATSHQNGGADEINVAGLNGVLADPQPPIIGPGATQAVAGNDPRLTDARTPTAHAVSHENGGTDEITVLGLSGLLADDQTPLTHDILTKHNGFPGGGTTFLRDDGTFAVPPAAATDVRQTEIDFGAIPVAEAEFTIVDVDVTPASNLIGSVAYAAPTGKDLDELEMDGLDLKFGPGSGQFTVYVRGMDGYIADTFKLNYIIGS